MEFNNDKWNRNILIRIKRLWARLLLYIFRDKENIPYPWLDFVVQYAGGPWAGATLYFEIRKRSYHAKKNKIIRYGKNIILIGGSIILLLSTIKYLMDEKSFWFGFYQNLFADFIVALFIGIWLVQRLDKEKDRTIKVFAKVTEFNKDRTEIIRIGVYINHQGKEKYDLNEIMWDILIEEKLLGDGQAIASKGEINREDIIIYDVNCFRILGVNEIPLMPETNYKMVDIPVKIEMNNEGIKFQEIYYSITTPYGHYPEVDYEKVQLDGVPLEEIDVSSFYGTLREGDLSLWDVPRYIID